MGACLKRRPRCLPAVSLRNTDLVYVPNVACDPGIVLVYPVHKVHVKDVFCIPRTALGRKHLRMFEIG